jgi:glutamine amidotransferase
MTARKPKVVIVDYGLGNVVSVFRAFDYIGAEPILTEDPTAVTSADRLVLPGVGAFGDGMAQLRERQLVEPLLEFAQTGKPFLGICLGMQMMFEESTEFGQHAGLSLLPGAVIEIPLSAPDGRHVKVPHTGWSEIAPFGANRFEHPLLSETPAGSAFYFVHSFMAAPSDMSHCIAAVDYEGITIPAAISRDNLTGMQFHPEKSGPMGLDILRRFLSL